MYQVVFEKQAKEFLDSIPSGTKNRVIQRITTLAVNPYAKNNNVKKLKGREGYRLRIGNIRVIYDIADDVLMIYILFAGFRKDIYKE